VLLVGAELKHSRAKLYVNSFQSSGERIVRMLLSHTFYMFGLVVIFRLFAFEECWQTVCELTYYKCKFVLYLIIYYLCSYLLTILSSLADHYGVLSGNQLDGPKNVIQLANFKLLGSTNQWNQNDETKRKGAFATSHTVTGNN